MYGDETDANSGRNIFETIKEGDVETAARLGLQRLINKHLHEQLSTQFLLDIETSTPTQKLYFVPKSLRGALWLQLSFAVEYTKDYKRCPVCEEWFEVSHRMGARTDKQYCSDACRQKAYRRRQGRST